MKFPITSEHLRGVGIDPEEIIAPYPEAGIAAADFCELILSKRLECDVVQKISWMLKGPDACFPDEVHRWAGLKLCLDYLPSIEAFYPDSPPPANLLKKARAYIIDRRTLPEFERAVGEFRTWRKSLSHWSDLEPSQRSMVAYEAWVGLDALENLEQLQSQDPKIIINDLCDRAEDIAEFDSRGKASSNAAVIEHYRDIVRAYQWATERTPASRRAFDRSKRGGWDHTTSVMKGIATLDPIHKTCLIFMKYIFDISPPETW